MGTRSAWCFMGLDPRATVLWALLVLSPSAIAWDFTSSVQIGATFTDNYQLQSDSGAQQTFYFDFTPSFRLVERSRRLNANVSYAPRLVYRPFESSKSETQNTLSGTGKYEMVSDTVFLDADASISQSYLSPFGPTAIDDGTSSSNLTESTIYGLSPYVTGWLGRDIKYEGRYRWRRVEMDAASTQGSQVTQWSGFIDKVIRENIGWNVAYSWSETDYSVRRDTVNSRLIGSLNYRWDEELTLATRLGYETNNYSAVDRSVVNYGAGIVWAPNPRTSATANWDQRYFGQSYDLDLSHRFRSSRLSLLASRQASTFSEQFLNTNQSNPLIAEFLLQQRLDRLYPDPASRQKVADYLDAAGLTAGDLQGLYSDQVTQREQVLLRYALLGARTTIDFNTFWRRNETIIETLHPDVPANLGLNSNNTQRGGSVDFSLKGTPRSTLAISLGRTWTESTLPNDNRESTEDSLRVTVTQQMSAKTTGTVGLRYRDLTGNTEFNYTEHAVFATLNHTF